MKYVVAVGVALVGVVVGALATLLLGIRFQIPAVLRAVRLFTRDVTNPRILAKAGTAATGTAVIRHVGRRSGRDYRTPVEVIVGDGGYVIALPYGVTADWVRNVLAAGSATLELRGDELPVEAPQLIELDDVIRGLPMAEALQLRIFGVQQGLWLTAVVSTSA